MFVKQTASTWSWMSPQSDSLEMSDNNVGLLLWLYGLIIFFILSKLINMRRKFCSFFSRIIADVAHLLLRTSSIFIYNIYIFYFLDNVVDVLHIWYSNCSYHPELNTVFLQNLTAQKIILNVLVWCSSYISFE